MSCKTATGLALGAGLSRGFAHIGVFKVLAREGISIDYMAGASMGSAMGALYASGLKLSVLEKLALRINRKHWIDYTMSGKGFVSGERLENLIGLLTRHCNIEDLASPLHVVATDLNKGRRVVFKKGYLARAVRASCSMPGIFLPVQEGDKLLVDGGVLERVPVKEVKRMGADIVVAVDVSAGMEEYEIKNVFDVISKTIDIMSKELSSYRIKSADVVVAPDLKDISPSDFTRVEETIKRGEEAAEDVIPKLKKIIKERERGGKNCEKV